MTLNSRNPTIYVVTYHEFNHGSLRPGPPRPLDERLLNHDKNYVFYLIDKEVPEVLKNKKTILEYDLDPMIHKAGGQDFGEWSFLLAEEKHSFCEYPFFMISSRFYEKNQWIHKSLNEEWDTLFQHLAEYGFGYLPSYDRPIRWIDLSWEQYEKKGAWKYRFSPFTAKTYELIKTMFGVNIPKDYRYTADLFCNYIGFNTRQDLLDYVAFYKSSINYFFDDELKPKIDLTPYIRRTGSFRNEKIFTFFLELLCHLFFFQTKKPYFALHYDGYYHVDEFRKKLTKIDKFSIPMTTQIDRILKWQKRRLLTEGCLAPYQPHLSALKRKVKSLLC
ncbi:MAG: hypothetical protein KBC64_03665 [Simkaniaceae bacterium]|nr:hypothetical protein [Simkaniaceae bacterium]